MKTYVRPSAALLRQSVTAPQGLKTSVLKSHPPAASPMPAAKNSAKTFVSPNAAGLPQSRQRPARHQKHLFPRSPHAPATPATTSTPKNICSLTPRRPATIRHGPASYRKHLFPRSPHAPATPATTSTPKNICSLTPRRPAAIRHGPASYRKHPFPRSPHAPATPATTSTPKNICSPSRPATSTYANNPGTTPSQMLKTYVLTIGRDAAPCRHFPEIGHVSPAQNRAASTQSSQYSASSSRQPGSPGSTPRPQAAQKKTGSGVFSSGQPTR